MPIHVEIDRLNNLTTFIVHNEVTADDALEAIKPIYEDPHLRPTLNMLWDYREGSPDPSIKDEDLEKIISYLSKHAGKRAGGKTAIVARTDFEYDVSKKYEFFTKLQGLSISIEVFRTLDEAMTWLNKPNL